MLHKHINNVFYPLLSESVDKHAICLSCYQNNSLCQNIPHSRPQISRWCYICVHAGISKVSNCSIKNKQAHIVNATTTLISAFQRPLRLQLQKQAHIRGLIVERRLYVHNSNKPLAPGGEMQ